MRSTAICRVGRPRGTYGAISLALLAAAGAAAGPATMVQLACRARVGYDVARFKVSYLVRVGALVAVTQVRPRLYALPDEATCIPPGALAAAVVAVIRSAR